MKVFLHCPQFSFLSVRLLMQVDVSYHEDDLPNTPLIQSKFKETRLSTGTCTCMLLNDKLGINYIEFYDELIIIL